MIKKGEHIRDKARYRKQGWILYNTNVYSKNNLLLEVMNMSMKRIMMVLAVVAILCSAFVQNAMADDLIVVATKATQQASLNWVSFLESNEVPLKLVTPQEFSKHKQKKYIILMGGVDEPEGIRELVKEALSGEEMQWVSHEGNGKMYVKSGVWKEGQRVIIFAGSNRKAADEARKSTKDNWFDLLSDWFDIESGGGLHAY
jgi:hypothetical protein